eukprot:CAMPEP_0204068848 /NCGR_PEP_ID=MMETSP0360-20130528/155964_1 /ASSEMBLY_ACC=CAM_ASM_000342 /TAXON_ID=268821 /ORGANISM="Scrippsiella Hangoei, Strain SHTV-5" /LENGTH=90 /DNA_ID=CAMNT_0051016993 /DNA_START=124 /DNA_END=393 /DNA_ORIENTATION=-
MGHITLPLALVPRPIRPLQLAPALARHLSIPDNPLPGVDAAIPELKGCLEKGAAVLHFLCKSALKFLTASSSTLSCRRWRSSEQTLRLDA